MKRRSHRKALGQRRLVALLGVSFNVLAVSVAAQEDATPPPCSDPGFRQFDFWIGSWDLTWGDDGRGTNVIEHKLGHCVVQENFTGGDFHGLSVSTYDPALGVWKQTWVDNAGGYLDFVGAWHEDRMVLSRTAVEDGQETLQRMTFRDIERDSLTWDWETSADGGATWEMRWQIQYRRAAER